MNIFIVEDEAIAARRLTKMLGELKPESRVCGVADSVQTAVEWFRENPAPDLALMDIELLDGQSFLIFEKVPVPCPVIFITAYDDYAIRAFKLNSIDYLLKPVEEEELLQSLNKLEKLKLLFSQSGASSLNITSLIGELKKQVLGQSYRTCFLIKSGQQYLPLDTTSIAYFYATQKYVMAHLPDNKEYVLEHTLDELETLLNPKDFFRANRQYIIARKAISHIYAASFGKLSLTLLAGKPESVVVSRERAAEFKCWMNH